VIEVLAFALLLVAVVGYMVYDRVMTASKLKRASTDGFAPTTGPSPWIVSAILSAVCLTLAGLEYFDKQPSASAKRRLFSSFAEQFFGPKGPALLLLAFALAFLVHSVLTHPRRQKRRNQASGGKSAA
jgi:Na+/proline symporter